VAITRLMYSRMLSVSGEFFHLRVGCYVIQATSVEIRRHNPTIFYAICYEERSHSQVINYRVIA